jgi:hypothetical protein
MSLIKDGQSIEFITRFFSIRHRLKTTKAIANLITSVRSALMSDELIRFLALKIQSFQRKKQKCKKWRRRWRIRFTFARDASKSKSWRGNLRRFSLLNILICPRKKTHNAYCGVLTKRYSRKFAT